MFERNYELSAKETKNTSFGWARRLLTRSGHDGHAKAGAKTGGDLVLVRTQ